MSREIKFRVRNLNTGRVIGYETVSDGMWFISAKGQDWENGTYSPAEGVKLQREQYISLIVNGVEVYERDVVRLVNSPGHDNAGHMQGIGVAEFHPYELKFMALSADGRHLMLDWGGTESIEVIGNIYENPELLK